MNEDAALGYVLGTLDDEEMAQARARLGTDASFASAVERAREDVEGISRGIEMVAEGTSWSETPDRGPSIWVRVVAVAAAVALAATGVSALVNAGGDADPGGPPQMGHQVPGLNNLSTLTRDAVAVVTGTVTRVDLGQAGGEGGMDYAIATVRVAEALKGSIGSTVSALDYVYGITPGGQSGVTSGGQSGVWVSEGDQVLLFLASSAGTVHEDIDPPHLQVLHGTAGRYFIRDGELVDAPFTMAEVREAF